MTLQEPPGDEIDEEALRRLGIYKERGIYKEKKKTEKKLLLISFFDESYGPYYTCPFCAEEKLMDDFNFCPNCGGNMEGYGFETIRGGSGKDEERK